MSNDLKPTSSGHSRNLNANLGNWKRKISQYLIETDCSTKIVRRVESFLAD
jgi:hypothetical protein